ncbi:unnamed protein product [Amoebophrya sp. A120]|nr:unnamed protein product [Amoebophrya sp. A120]|eukprot:GSA120T00022449001.1
MNPYGYGAPMQHQMLPAQSKAPPGMVPLVPVQPLQPGAAAPNPLFPQLRPLPPGLRPLPQAAVMKGAGAPGGQPMMMNNQGWAGAGVSGAYGGAVPAMPIQPVAVGTSPGGFVKHHQFAQNNNPYANFNQQQQQQPYLSQVAATGHLQYNHQQQQFLPPQTREPVTEEDHEQEVRHVLCSLIRECRESIRKEGTTTTDEHDDMGDGEVTDIENFMEDPGPLLDPSAQSGRNATRQTQNKFATVQGLLQSVVDHNQALIAEQKGRYNALNAKYGKNGGKDENRVAGKGGGASSSSNTKGGGNNKGRREEEVKFGDPTKNVFEEYDRKVERDRQRVGDRPRSTSRPRQRRKPDRDNSGREHGRDRNREENRNTNRERDDRRDRDRDRGGRGDRDRDRYDRDNNYNRGGGGRDRNRDDNYNNRRGGRDRDYKDRGELQERRRGDDRGDVREQEKKFSDKEKVENNKTATPAAAHPPVESAENKIRESPREELQGKNQEEIKRDSSKNANGEHDHKQNNISAAPPAASSSGNKVEPDGNSKITTNKDEEPPKKHISGVQEYLAYKKKLAESQSSKSSGVQEYLEYKKKSKENADQNQTSRIGPNKNRPKGAAHFIANEKEAEMKAAAAAKNAEDEEDLLDIDMKDLREEAKKREDGGGRTSNRDNLNQKSRDVQGDFYKPHSARDRERSRDRDRDRGRNYNSRDRDRDRGRNYNDNNRRDHNYDRNNNNRGDRSHRDHDAKKASDHDNRDGTKRRTPRDREGEKEGDKHDVGRKDSVEIERPGGGLQQTSKNGGVSNYNSKGDRSGGDQRERRTDDRRNDYNTGGRNYRDRDYGSGRGESRGRRGGKENGGGKSSRW